MMLRSTNHETLNPLTTKFQFFSLVHPLMDKATHSLSSSVYIISSIRQKHMLESRKQDVNPRYTKTLNSVVADRTRIPRLTVQAVRRSAGGVTSLHNTLTSLKQPKQRDQRPEQVEVCRKERKGRRAIDSRLLLVSE